MAAVVNYYLCCIFSLVLVFSLFIYVESATYPCTESGLDNAITAGGEAVLACTTSSTIYLSSSKTVSWDLDISGNNLLTINGSNNYNFRIQPSINVVFRNMKITNARGAEGGAFYVSLAILQLVQVTVAECSGSNGGALYVLYGSAFINNSAIYSNYGAGSVYSMGSDIHCYSSTIAAGNNQQGMVFDSFNPPSVIDYCTLTAQGNKAALALLTAGTVSVSRSIILSAGVYTYGEIISLGYNIVQDEITPIYPSTGDLLGVDPKLDYLGNHGGTTYTYNLLPGSPAVNAVNNFAPPTTDQIGTERDYHGAPDIGAYESMLYAGVYIAPPEVNATEGRAAVLSIILDYPSVPTVTVFWETVSGTAIAGVDFIHKAGSVSWEYPNIGPQSFVVDILNPDMLYLPDRSFTVQISSQNATLLNTHATVTIQDDDAASGCGSTCDDGNPCTVDVCGVTGCQHIFITCDDGDACTIDTCNPSVGCVATNITCNDNNTCTVDTCDRSTGTCRFSSKCDDGNACTSDTCDPLTGTCNSTRISCNDGDACTVDRCDMMFGCWWIPRYCNDFNACTADSCNTTTGCSNVPIVCNDFNACTIDTCHVEYGCQFNATNCDDSNACTADSCSPDSGCIHTPIVCESSDACKVAACDSVRGCQLSNKSCDDGNACTADSCNSVTGCNHTRINCDDGNVCTVDLCDVVTGCTHVAVSCNDGNACTTETCHPTLGCQFSNVSCDDGNACTIDSCDAVSGCRHTPRSCDDGNACTIDSCNTTSGCKNTAITCNDGNACTTDTCNPTRGCQYTNISCNDGNACTIDSCDINVGCKYKNVSCDDGNSCTVDTCNPSSGCQYTNMSCNDNNPCTIDSCSASGCVYTNNVDAYWEHRAQGSWQDGSVIVSQWLAVLHNGNAPLYAIEFTITPQPRQIWNAELKSGNTYTLPSWQYTDGQIPPGSTSVSFGYTVQGISHATIVIDPGACVPNQAGCTLEVSTQLVNSWYSNGQYSAQYNVVVNNRGTRPAANVKFTLNLPNRGAVSSYWNMAPTGTQNQYKCSLYNLSPGQTSTSCGFIATSPSAPANSLGVSNVQPVCV